VILINLIKNSFVIRVFPIEEIIKPLICHQHIEVEKFKNLRLD